MENHPCFKIFQEIMYHNSRLAVLGVEAIKVLDLMKGEGVQEEVLGPFVEVANKAAEAETTTKKSRRWETKNLSTDEDSRTDTILERLRDLSNCLF